MCMYLQLQFYIIFGVPRAQPREVPTVGCRGRVDLGYAAKKKSIPNGIESRLAHS